MFTFEVAELLPLIEYAKASKTFMKSAGSARTVAERLRSDVANHATGKKRL